MSKFQKLIMEYKDSPRSISVETGQFGAYHADQLIGLDLDEIWKWREAAWQKAQEQLQSSPP
jgi:hypothetical protein